MPVHPISIPNLTSITTSPDHNPTKPIYMLNLWKYKDTAVYSPEHAHLSPAPCTGKEAVGRYREAIASVLPPGASLFATFDVLTEVAAPVGEKWDYVAVVRYENLEGFIAMVESEKYKGEVEPHRLAGLEEWRLVLMDKVEMGGMGEEK